MFTEGVVDKFTPACWWESMSDTFGKDVAQVAQKLLTAIASSAGIERLFSTFGYIHSKIRNRLGIEKAAKLVFVYRMLNVKKEIFHLGHFYLLFIGQYIMYSCDYLQVAFIQFNVYSNYTLQFP